MDQSKVQMESSIFCLEGVTFPSLDGFELLPDRTGITNGSIVAVCSHLAGSNREVKEGFSESGMVDRGLKFLSETQVSVAGMVCEATRFSQQVGETQLCKWAVFFPFRSETKIFVITFLSEADEVEQIENVREILGRVKVDASYRPDATFQSFIFSEAGSFQVGNKTSNQVTLSIDGQFPLKNPLDPLISISEIPMRLLPQQFKPFVGKRLASLNAVEGSVQIVNLSDAVLAIKGSILVDGVPQGLIARYIFFPRYVVSAEAFVRNSDSEKLLVSIQSVFDTIKPSSVQQD